MKIETFQIEINSRWGEDMKALKEMRRQHDLKTMDMAKELGISQCYYSLIENGKRGISYEMAVRIAAIFNKKPDDVFYDDFQHTA